MDKHNPPTAFGVFKPIGHTLLAFATQAERRGATRAMLALGLSDASMVVYSAPEMLQLADEELQAAGPMAHFGYELDLLRAHRVLAQQGCSFLIVHVPDEAQADQVAGLVAALQPQAAQRYGRFLAHDLTAPAAARH
jgi:hypothetical protein